MDTLEQHVERLLALNSDRARKRYLGEHSDFRCDEAARHLCRSAVALLYTDVARARTLCRTLTSLASLQRDGLSAAYRDHAWAALYFSSGSDYRKAFFRWKRALARFDAAGRDDEAAITCSSGLHTLIYVNRLDLFWEWEIRARLVFERAGDRLRLGRLRSNVAALHSARDEWKLAAQAYQLAFEDFVAAGAKNSDTFTLLCNLSICHTFIGDLPRAAHLLEKARAACVDAGFHGRSHRLESSTAYIKFLQGDLASALAVARRTREYGSRQGLLHHSSTSALTEAEILLALCLPRDAERQATQALKGFARLGSMTEQGRALMTIGQCARMRGDSKRALDLYAEAMRLFEGCGNVPNAQRAALLQATSIFESGDHQLGATLARGLLDSMSSDPSNSTTISCRLLLARILLERGEFQEALRLAETALAHVSLLDRAPLEAEALHLFGRIHERSGDLARASDAYLQCENCIARIRRRLAPGHLKTSFLSNKADLYEDLFWVGARLGFSPARIFEFAEKAKSRTLAEQLARQFLSPPAALRNPACVELLEQWRGVRASVKQIEELGVLSEPSGALRLDDLRRRLNEVEISTAKLMRSEDFFDGSIPPSTSLPDAKQVASCLPEDTALLQFYFARGSIFVFHISKRDCEVIPVAEARRAERVHRLVRFHLRTRPPTGSDGDAQRFSLMEHLEELYQLLWTELRARLDVGRLVLIPHGFLHHVPFHALFDGDEFLIDRHAITYCPSAGVFHATRNAARATTGSGSLVVGSSDHNAPAILVEAQDVAEIVPNARVLLDGQATKARLLRELPRADLVHIAAHGAFSPVDASASTIRLGDDSLTVIELQGLRLQAELVVLSGCETGRSVTRGSDEVLGLTQALLQAGARSALVSLWKVDDQSTADFMRLFHLEMRRTSNRAEALRNAQLAHRQTYNHPYFWAPFVIVGDPEPSAGRTLSTPDISREHEWN